MDRRNIPTVLLFYAICVTNIASILKCCVFLDLSFKFSLHLCYLFIFSQVLFVFLKYNVSGQDYNIYESRMTYKIVHEDIS
jgi:thiosulfate reductase cytochrome b subunit